MLASVLMVPCPYRYHDLSVLSFISCLTKIAGFEFMHDHHASASFSLCGLGIIVLIFF